MSGSKRGFTMVEVVITLMVAVILISIAVRGFGGTMSRLAVDNARQSFAALQARTRSYAVERAEMTRLYVDPDADVAWIDGSSGQVAFIDFMGERGVDVQSSTSGTIRLCMNARGFAETDCNSFNASTVELDFVQGGESASITILPLGQLSW